MPNLSMEVSIFISVIIALVLPFIGVSVLFTIVLIGFIASALAGSEGNSFKVGGIAGGVLSVLYFLIKFFTPPTLAYGDPSNLFMPDIFMASQGFVYLALGFVFSLAMFMVLGAFGGLIAEEIFGPKKSEPKRGNANRNVKSF